MKQPVEQPMAQLMRQSSLFHRTRWRLAGWYTASMGGILFLLGCEFYGMTARAHEAALDRELESIAQTLKSSLEEVLHNPGQLESDVTLIIPGLCVANDPCPTRRYLILPTKGHYLRLVNLIGQPVATLGLQPSGLPTHPPSPWQTLSDQRGQRYHQVTLALQTSDQQTWGTLQVGRSLEEIDAELATLRLTLMIGLPVAMGLAIATSWWLAGLAIQPIYQSYQQVQQFTADAAHELRTPLAAIRATVEAAQAMEESSAQEMQTVLYTVGRQTHLLGQIVQDLLLLSHLDGQRHLTKRQPCNLNDLIADLTEEFAAMAIAADLELTDEIRVSQALIVEGDPDQLYRVVINLLANAIKYTLPGGRVTLWLERDHQGAVIGVEDTGIGIAPEEQARIFDRFYRVSGDRSRQTGGVGLGLSIAQAIAHAHQGRLQVNSQVGQGSLFTLWLPL